MEREEIVAEKDGGGKSVDRCKVRILLCDTDAREEVLNVLCKCSYQVTSLRSARQVIDALNAEGADIDIIWTEMGLPAAERLKMLKYIKRSKELQRIPVMIMSAQDETSILVKCCIFGVADHVVKPLRTNELLKLWTRVWRRRRMTGLAEKNAANDDYDLEASDTSDADKNSTSLFSDETDDKSWRSPNPETRRPTRQESEVNAIGRQILSNAATAATPVEPPPFNLVNYRPNVPEISDRRTGEHFHMPLQHSLAPVSITPVLFSGQLSSCPKMSKVTIGESSAFIGNVKSCIPKRNTQGIAPVDENAPMESLSENKLGNTTQNHETRKAWENHSQGDESPCSSNIRDVVSIQRSHTAPVHLEFPHQRNSKVEEFPQLHQHPRNSDVSGFHAHAAYPYYIPGVMNQTMMLPTPMYQIPQALVPQVLPNHGTSTMLPQYGHISQYPHITPCMTSFPYYPVSMFPHPGQIMPTTNPGQLPTTHPFPSSPATGGKLGKVDIRKAALIKFRQKRKRRCFEKKIRYVNRQQLAESRPRVRGQFVRKRHAMNVDLNRQPASVDSEED